MSLPNAQPTWLLTLSGVGLSGASNDLSLVWIDDGRLGGPVDLECIVAAEADRRVACGQFPSGLMLGRALFRAEAAKPAPSPWVR
ncbi:MAG: hypothetical protein ACXWMB_03560, partial [Candidatus Limnocylindria bacterium]